LVLYEEQDTNLWDQELIQRGEYYLNESAKGNEISKYHLEAAIAYGHTRKEDSEEKWSNILQQYNILLMIEYSPMAALNRTYALSKVSGKKIALEEAQKLELSENHLYHSLLGDLYIGLDNKKALKHFETALKLAKSSADKLAIVKKSDKFKNNL
jgi:predicted RNA polymerase sigma factor